MLDRFNFLSDDKVAKRACFRYICIMKVYADTSIIGGCFDEEFKEWSIPLFQEFKFGIKYLMLSDLTYQELEYASLEIKNSLDLIPQEFKINVTVNDEAITLAETYINEGALTNKSYNDALHIAIATISNSDVLASWNFKHIVNLNRIRIYNSINLRLGYKLIEIRTPREILNNNENE
jgi:hypothetical protein